MAPTSRPEKLNSGSSDAADIVPPASASASDSIGYRSCSVRNAGAFGFRLSPNRPTAWQLLNVLLDRGGRQNLPPSDRALGQRLLVQPRMQIPRKGCQARRLNVERGTRNGKTARSPVWEIILNFLTWNRSELVGIGRNASELHD